MSLSPDVTDLRLILDSTAWTPRCVSGTWIPQEKISRIPECGFHFLGRNALLDETGGRLDLPAISTAVSASKRV